MLQLSGVLLNSTIRMTSYRITQQLLNSTLSNTDPVVLDTKKQPNDNDEGTPKVQINNIIKAVDLFGDTATESNESTLLSKDVEHLLSAMKSGSYNSYKAIGAFTELTELIKKKQLNVTEVVEDERFLKMISLLGNRKNKVTASNENNLNDTLPLITNHTENLIKMLKNMSIKKNRNVTEINNITNAILTSKLKLDIKQASDILYSLGCINYPIESVIRKVCEDLLEIIPVNTNRAVIKSITTSLGILQYNDPEILNEISNWYIDNWTKVKCEDIVTFSMTLAILNYIPPNGETLIEKCKTFKVDDMVEYEQWLNLIWSLVILNKANKNQIASVLDPSFTKLISELELKKSQSILNINAAAKLIFKDTYEGPFIENVNNIQNEHHMRNNKKFIKSVLEPLVSILPTTAVINTNVNSEMGFNIDIECLIDDKSYRTLVTNPKETLKKSIKIAVILQNFRDFTLGTKNLTGIMSFQCKLLKLAGYKVLTIPYTEYDMETSLITRLKTLKTLLTEILNESN